MQKFYTALLILIFGVISCQKNSHADRWEIVSESDFKDLPFTKLKGTPMEVNSAELNTTYSISVFDSLLIIEKLVATPTFIEILSLKTGKSIGSFGTLGGGPLEFPTFIRPKLMNSKKGYISITVPNDDGAYYEIPIASILNKNLNELKRLYQFGPKNTVDVVNIGNGKFAALSIGSEQRLVIVDTINSTIGGVFEYPFADEMGIPKSRLGLAFQGYLLQHPTQNRLAIFDEWSPTWDIIGFDKNDFWSIYSNHLRPPIVQDLSYQEGNVTSESIGVLLENQMAFFSPSATSEFIFTLYSGRNMAKWESASDTPNTVIVFDWSGQVVNKFELDRDVKCIAISKDNKSLYAFVETIDKNQIIKYDLPSIQADE